MATPSIGAFTAVVRVQFLSAEHAALAARVLAVDDELQPERASKTFTVSGSELVATLSASEARVLRVVISSFFDMAAVVARTLAEFS